MNDLEPNISYRGNITHHGFEIPIETMSFYGSREELEKISEWLFEEASKELRKRLAIIKGRYSDHYDLGSTGVFDSKDGSYRCEYATTDGEHIFCKLYILEGEER